MRSVHDFTSDMNQLAGMRDAVRAVCEQMWGLDGQRENIHQFELALHEAATNVIRHAYQGQAGLPIQLVLEGGPEEVSATLFHHGPEFDPDSAPPPAFDGSRAGGFGVYLIKQLVNEVRYFRDDAGRSAVRMVKRRRSPSSASPPCN